MEPIGGLEAITIDCADPLALTRFWAAVFGTGIEEPNGDPPQYVDLVPVPGVPILRFQRVPEPKSTKNRLHFDVSVENLDEASERIEVLGGTSGSRPDLTEYGYEWRVMADPEGNEFCLVIPP